MEEIKELEKVAYELYQKFYNIQHGLRTMKSYGIITGGPSGFTKKQYLDYLNKEYKEILVKIKTLKEGIQ